jgi:hypothetical protein
VLDIVYLTFYKVFFVFSVRLKIFLKLKYLIFRFFIKLFYF